MSKGRRSRAVAAADASGAASGWVAAVDRWLSIFDMGSASDRQAKLSVFERVLLIVSVSEYWTRALKTSGGLIGTTLLNPVLATVFAGAALYRPLRRPAFLSLALLHAVLIYNDFPARGNHAYLETIFFLMAALLDPVDEEEGRLYVRSILWIVCVIFFFAGVQKAVQGYYFQGQYLAYSVSRVTYRPVLSPFLSSAEFERLVGLTGRVGSGPYLISEPLFLAVSNLVWIGEILLVPLFIYPATRTLAMVGALLLIAAIEAGARELYFGLIYTNAILLLARTNLHRYVVVPIAILAFLMIGVRAGFLPDAVFF